jgi:hypothetical protein
LEEDHPTTKNFCLIFVQIPVESSILDYGSKRLGINNYVSHKNFSMGCYRLLLPTLPTTTCFLGRHLTMESGEKVFSVSFVSAPLALLCALLCALCACFALLPFPFALTLSQQKPSEPATLAHNSEPPQGLPAEQILQSLSAAQRKSISLSQLTIVYGNQSGTSQSSQMSVKEALADTRSNPIFYYI